MYNVLVTSIHTIMHYKMHNLRGIFNALKHIYNALYIKALRFLHCDIIVIIKQ